MDLGSYYGIPNVFTPQECDNIIKEYSNKILKNGSVVKGTRNVRKTELFFIEPNNDTDWIYRRLATVVSELNNKFKFDLDQSFQLVQFTKYEKGSFYDWHVDVGPSPETCFRKLSVVVQLSWPNYEGGKLQFGNTDDEVFDACPEKGSVTVFPSILRHRVTQVTKGTRYSLVAWATGPSFK